MHLRIVAAIICLVSFAILASVETVQSKPINKKESGVSKNSLGSDRNLDDAFIFPDGGTAFDSDLWKTKPNTRFSMLFDLYHQPLSKISPLQTYILLGQPAEVQDGLGGGHAAFSAYYDLGERNNLKTYLEVFFRDHHLESLGIQQRSTTPFPRRDFLPDWQLTNINWATIANEYNRHLFLVGMPVKLISSVVGFIATETSSHKDGYKRQAGITGDDNIHCFGPFEFTYTQDNLNVLKFRINCSKSDGTEKYTAWETQNLRTDPRCLVRYSEYFNLKSRLGPYMTLGMPFSKSSWRGEDIEGLRGLAKMNRRNALVTDLVRANPIIGKTRDDIHDLLSGPPTWKPAACSGDSEAYQLTASGCGNTGENFLEFSFDHNRVTGFRVIHAGGEGYGETTVSNGASFNYFEVQ
ncbi:MAG: hypothetical protein JST89_13845 [Cyanobacteria bacterium SZAS-4]|nr:hypothetical protein [Cyanobacteria bacterium SZAS-4]